MRITLLFAIPIEVPNSQNSTMKKLPRFTIGMGTRYTDALKANCGIVGRRVRDNLLKKHIEPLFC
jgi:hypothetical protein